MPGSHLQRELGFPRIERAAPTATSVDLGPGVETAILAWVCGIVVAAIAAYFGTRLAHGALVNFVVKQFDSIDMPPLGNFTPPWTWMA